MTTEARTSDDAEPTMGPDALDYERYGAVETGDDELIVYDVDDSAGWVQSSAFVDLGDRL